ncbi:MAG TPA: hypothetical protein VFO10_04890 [Oligoflexus sp.]|uniref:hypothetical protein n=1 Tax=Oligoflexus sp. TaxID=1971216 RepID=UPI002D7F1A07|nr:hypothetical protein [Oligoflexus sp.]HET9236560.1 hypothetical protein [Oligoflexus sp.]
MRRLRCLPFFILIISCGFDQRTSRLAAGREARYLLATPENLSDGFWNAIKNPALPQDFLLQRQAGWDFWAEMLRPLHAASHPNFLVWQSWYGREDLQRIFRHLYENLGPAGRRERRELSPTVIQDGIRWNDELQFHDAGWDARRFEEWFARYDTDEKKRSIPGMQKILFNQTALTFLLQNYERLEICQKERQRQGTCEDLHWPERAVFLKTAWRRSEQGFLVERFPTAVDDLRQQWQEPQWTAGERYEPAADESFAVRLPSGQKFHLTGLHASLRLEANWYWTSLWLGPKGADDFASDQGDRLNASWKPYRLCSVYGWSEPLREQTMDDHWPQPLAKVAQLMVDQKLFNWCSNPYLEPGPNNHKTNCIGCHQYAGLNWTQQDFRQRLTDDFTSLVQRNSVHGPADFVWSLYAGPEPLIQPLMDDIEFFDVYDPYQ